METYLVYGEYRNIHLGHAINFNMVCFSRKEAEELIKRRNKRSKKYIYKYMKIKNTKNNSN